MPPRSPAETFSPGEFIRDELDARGWTQGDLAQIMGRPLQFVNELAAGKKQITPETAVGLAKAFGDEDALYWMNLDSAYRLARTKPADESVARRAKLYSTFPMRELVKRNWIEASENLDVIEHRICRFYHIKSIDDQPKFAHAAKSDQYVERTPIQWAWLYRAKELAAAVHSVPYQEGKLREALRKLRTFLVAPEEIRQIPQVLAAAGVRFVVVEFIPGAKVDGAAFWVEETPVIAMSLQFDRLNNFWFVLRHEIEHVLNKDGSVMLDVELTESLERRDHLPVEEVRANEAASEYLVPKSELDNFITRVRPLYSEQRILLFAKRIGVHPGLVVGQLQFRTEVPYTHFHKHLVKIREIVTQTALTDGWGTTPRFPEIMGSRTMTTLNDQLLKIVEDYRAAGEPWPASREQIAEWAVANERYQLTRGMAVSQCAEKISRAMGLDHVKDRKGRSVRKYYAARIRENGQLVMKWDDLNAERPFMEVAAANRRNQVLGQCWQLKTDIDSYNERKCPQEPIQMDFNFNVDLEELSQLDDIA